MSEQLLKHSQRVVNVFGGVGYSLLMALYAAVIALGLIWLLSAGYMDPLGFSADFTAPREVPEEQTDVEVSMVGSILAYLVTGFMVVTAIFVLMALPYWLGRLGSKWLKRLIRLCQISVTPASLLIGKLIACGLAIVPSSIMVIADAGALYLAASSFLISLLAVVVFILQHAIAAMSRFEAKDIW